MSFTPDETYLRSRIAELEQQLAFANDAAAKGEAARLNAAGMEEQIADLQRSLASAELIIKQHLNHCAVIVPLAEECLNEIDKVRTV